MKIERRKSPKKLLVICAIVVAVAALGIASYIWWQRSQAPTPSQTTDAAPTNTVNYGPATEQEKADSETAKQEALNEQSQPAASDSIVVVINRASQVDMSISIRTTVTGAQQGSCEMTFTKNGRTAITKTFQITMGPTAAACNGDIPVNEFGASGTWNLSVVAKNGTVVSAAVTQTVDVAP